MIESCHRQLRKVTKEKFVFVSILIAIGVSRDGSREILEATEGMKEDKESWCPLNHRRYKSWSVGISI